MSFVFEKIDAIEKERSQKDETLQRIRSWRESKKQQSITSEFSPAGSPDSEQNMALKKDENEGVSDSLMSIKREVELSHPWPEWVELMERLVKQNYFDHRRKDEDKMLENSGFSLSDMVDEDGFDFTRDLKTVLNAILNFANDRFDILRSLSRQDMQILVGYGCPSTDKRVVFSSKLLRKHTNLDEGDVCSSCSLRTSCAKAYLLLNKEDEARTIDVMRVLLTYAFGAVNVTVVNESLLKKKSLKVSIRKLLHEVVKLSAVPIDPNLPPPVIRKPLPKVKQPPTPPRKRVGRDDVEMKKGDWLCPKCDFMNFAKNTVCLQCDDKRPKRQLLPGEWECPQCNFLNYRRNVVCFHCEHKRPQDEFMERQMQERQERQLRGPRSMEKIPNRRDVSDAWNFDFDENESDGADVAAFEYADSQKIDQDFPPDKGWGQDRYSKGSIPAGLHKEEKPEGGSSRPGIGFNDFDDEEDDDIGNYELDNQTDGQKVPRVDLSELEVDSESENEDQTRNNWHDNRRSNSQAQKKQPKAKRGVGLSGSDSEIDFCSDDDLPNHPKWKSSHVTQFNQKNKGRGAMSFGTDDLSSGSDDNFGTRKKLNQKRNTRLKYSSETDDMEDDSGSRRGRGNKSSPQKSKRRVNFDMEDDSFSDLESDNEGHFQRGKGGQRGRGQNRPPVHGGRDNRFSSRKDTFGGGRSSRGGGGGGRGGSHGKSFEKFDGNRRNSRDGEFRNAGNSGRGRSSFDRKRSSSSRYGTDNNNQNGSSLDDERYRRPRVNVR